MFCLPGSYKFRSGPGVSGVPPPAKKRSVETLVHSANIDCGSGFQPRFARSDKHLLIVASYERRRWPRTGQSNRKRNFDLVLS
jgi:hypothetical protein